MKSISLNILCQYYGLFLWSFVCSFSDISAQKVDLFQANQTPVVEFPNESTYFREAVYVHELINYAFHPRWNQQWEMNFLKTNGVRFTTGSIATDELLVEGQMTLNVNLQNGWWFISRGDWYEGRHQNQFRQTFYLGLERELSKKFSVFFMFFPRLEKELVDMQAGISWFSADREDYLNLALVLEDFMYNHKNERRGESLTTPLGIQWFARIHRDKFIFFSEGKYGSGFERVYPDSVRSPVETGHSRKMNYSDSKLYFQLSPSSLFILQFYRYFFAEGHTFYNENYSYDYQNGFNDLSLQYLFGGNRRHRFRLLCHGLWQDATADGYRGHHFERLDVMPAFFYEYHVNRHMIEVGYMVALNNWEYKNRFGQENYQRDWWYYDKAYLGYTFAFNPSARIHISISHQPVIHGFGGANAQYIMHF